MIDEYPHIYVITYANFRNDVLKDFREELKSTTRFVLGSPKILRVALGKTEEEEYKGGLSALCPYLKGVCGLVFTTLDDEEIKNKLADFSVLDFARAGGLATQTVELDEGPLKYPSGEPIPHTIEPFLRKQVRRQTNVAHYAFDFVG